MLSLKPRNSLRDRSPNQTSSSRSVALPRPARRLWARALLHSGVSEVLVAGQDDRPEAVAHMSGRLGALGAVQHRRVGWIGERRGTRNNSQHPDHGLPAPLGTYARPRGRRSSSAARAVEVWSGCPPPCISRPVGRTGPPRSVLPGGIAGTAQACTWRPRKALYLLPASRRGQCLPHSHAMQRLRLQRLSGRSASLHNGRRCTRGTLRSSSDPGRGNFRTRSSGGPVRGRWRVRARVDSPGLRFG